MKMTLKRPPEIDLKKGLHVKLLPETVLEFRILCFQRGLSMQEAVEELMQRTVIGDSWMLRVLDELALQKRERTPKKFTRLDAQSLYDQIERDEKARQEERENAEP